MALKTVGVDLERESECLKEIAFLIRLYSGEVLGVCGEKIMVWIN